MTQNRTSVTISMGVAPPGELPGELIGVSMTQSRPCVSVFNLCDGSDKLASRSAIGSKGCLLDLKGCVCVCVCVCVFTSICLSVLSVCL